MTEIDATDVEITNNGYALSGTLTRPAGIETPPVVLMIHGSGPLDRDENFRGQKLNVFNTLAERLAEAGYASLRYDKRGCGASEGDYYRTGHHDLVSDASAWFDHLASGHAGVFGSAYLLGHSEGTIISAQMALKDPRPAGLVLICPFVDDIESVLRRQSEIIEANVQARGGIVGMLFRLSFAVFGSPTKQQDKLIERLKSSDSDMLRLFLRKLEAKGLRELMALDPAEIYARVRTPCLVFAGEKDLQCDPGDAEKIAELVGDGATVHVEKDLMHMLRKDPDEPSFLSYRRLLKKPMDPSVARHVVDWLDAQEGKGIGRPG